MRCVSQRRWRLDDTRPGDCVRACMASLLELPLTAVPHFADRENWWGAWNEWLAERGWRVTTVYLTVDPADPTQLTGWTEGYWFGVVRSPRVQRVCDGEPCEECQRDGAHAGLHMVVMHGSEIAWDPHPYGRGQGPPEYAGHKGFVTGYYLSPIDPARFELH